jgi:hypothetical protein
MADLTQTAASVRVMAGNARVLISQAGEALTQGQPVYQATDNKWYRCDANDGVIKARCEGITLTSAASNGFFVRALPGSDIDLGATLVIGETYVVSVNVGAIAPIGDLAAASFVTTLGVAITASTLRFNPNPSGIQRAA